MTRRARRRTPKPRQSPAALDRLHPHAAGIDCGSAEHFVAGPPDRDATPVQSVVRRLRQRAEHLGFGLVNLSTGEVVEGAVSYEPASWTMSTALAAL